VEVGEQQGVIAAAVCRGAEVVVIVLSDGAPALEVGG
jgi:hypothetical protein